MTLPEHAKDSSAASAPSTHSTGVQEKSFPTTIPDHPQSKDSTQPGRAVRADSASSSSSLQIPRAARFAEATSVISPVSGSGDNRSPFADPPVMANQTAQPSDVGFGYISNEPVEQHATVKNNHLAAPVSPPLKSALKTPGTPGRNLNPLSPTFREEQMLEKQEEETEKEQAKDLVSGVPSTLS